MIEHKCKICGEPMEMTAEAYWTFSDDGLVLEEIPVEESNVRIYCGNDHAPSAEDRRAIVASIRGYSSFGRPPGSGSLNVAIPPPKPLVPIEDWRRDVEDDEDGGNEEAAPVAEAGPSDYGVAEKLLRDADAVADLIAAHPLKTIESEEELDRAIAFVNKLIDRDDLSPGEANCLDVLGTLIWNYEHRRVAVAAGVRYEAEAEAHVVVLDSTAPIPPHGPNKWDCTAFVEAFRGHPVGAEYLAGLDEDAATPDGFSDDEDVFRHDANAPEWIRKWPGPMEVVVRRVGPSAMPVLSTPDYEATFTPQAWVDGEAVDVDPEGETTWECSDYLLGLVDEGYRRPGAAKPYFATLESDIAACGEFVDVADVLRDDPYAPEWIRDWTGPFVITVRHAVD